MVLACAASSTIGQGQWRADGFQGQRILFFGSAGSERRVSLAEPLSVSAKDVANTIEVQFTSAVDKKSIVNGKSFIVVNENGAVMIGKIIFTAPDTVRWVVQISGAGASRLPAGNYRVTLKGDGPSVITSNGVALDGEPRALPSGDDVAGGDFNFTLSLPRVNQ